MKNLRRERQLRGWTLEQAAGKAGITKTTLGNLETGVKNPSYVVLIRLLDLYECSDPRWLFGEAALEAEETFGSG